jgi:Holliday junction resolvase RusA-like endonuclease
MRRVIWQGTIEGEPASKANSRRRVRSGKYIKSEKALNYCDTFNAQAAWITKNLVPFDGPVCVSMTIWYRSRRPDLDESLILDLLQGHAYVDDRKVHEKHITWALDRNRPRAEIVVETI